MPRDTSKTIEFPRVQPIADPPAAQAPAVPFADSGPPGPARSSMIPEWAGEDVDTARTTQVAPVAAKVVIADRALLTILTGLHAGQVFTVDDVETHIGRGRESAVRIDDVGISRTHARIVRTLEGQYLVEDLKSTNGVFVNGRRVERCDLVNGDRVQVGPTVVLRFALIDADEEALARQLYESSTRDALTRAFNRKYLNERLAAEVAYAARHRTRLSLLLFDIDHFKKVNDSHGHLAGDVVLRVVAAQVQRLIRTEDVFARYGGEEFVVLVRGIEHANVAVFAERIRRAVEKLTIPWEGRALRVTISVGVSSLGERPDGEIEPLVRLADERLYKAKTAGRNRVSS